MQFDKALQLRTAWGEKPCEHIHFEPEYFLDSPTGEYACLACGHTFSMSEKGGIEDARNAKAPETSKENFNKLSWGHFIY